MNSVTRRAAAIVLAVAVMFPPLAAADPRGRDQDRTEIVLRWLIQQAKKIAGIVTHGDVLIPPTPPPAPPSNPTQGDVLIPPTPPPIPPSNL